MKASRPNLSNLLLSSGKTERNAPEYPAVSAAQAMAQLPPLSNLNSAALAVVENPDLNDLLYQNIVAGNDGLSLCNAVAAWCATRSDQCTQQQWEQVVRKLGWNRSSPEDWRYTFYGICNAFVVERDRAAAGVTRESVQQFFQFIGQLYNAGGLSGAAELAWRIVLPYYRAATTARSYHTILEELKKLLVYFGQEAPTPSSPEYVELLFRALRDLQAPTYWTGLYPYMHTVLRVFYESVLAPGAASMALYRLFPNGLVARLDLAEIIALGSQFWNTRPAIAGTMPSQLPAVRDLVTEMNTRGADGTLVAVVTVMVYHELAAQLPFGPP